jgi:hypothetical protein
MGSADSNPEVFTRLRGGSFLGKSWWRAVVGLQTQRHDPVLHRAAKVCSSRYPARLSQGRWLREHNSKGHRSEPNDLLGSYACIRGAVRYGAAMRIGCGTSRALRFRSEGDLSRGQRRRELGLRITRRCSLKTSSKRCQNISRTPPRPISGSCSAFKISQFRQIPRLPIF